MLSARLCRVCCKKKQLDSDDDDAHETTTGTSRTTRRMTTKDGGDEESTGESSDRPGKPDDDDEPTLVFPDKLPDGTQVRPAQPPCRALQVEVTVESREHCSAYRGLPTPRACRQCFTRRSQPQLHLVSR